MSSNQSNDYVQRKIALRCSVCLAIKVTSLHFLSRNICLDFSVMVTLIAEQVRQQNAATATEAAAGCCRRGLAAIVPSFCVACSAHIHIHSHAHTLSLAFTQLAHTPIHTHTNTHAHIYRQSAVCDFFFHFHINLLIFSYILWSRFTVSALQFSKFSEFCIHCTHFHFICFATSGCRQWRRLQRRRRPADFGRWNYFTCSCILLFIFFLLLCSFRIRTHSSAAWLQLDYIANDKTMRFLFVSSDSCTSTIFNTNTHSYTNLKRTQNASFSFAANSTNVRLSHSY